MELEGEAESQGTVYSQGQEYTLEEYEATFGKFQNTLTETEEPEPQIKTTEISRGKFIGTTEKAEVQTKEVKFTKTTRTTQKAKESKPETEKIIGKAGLKTTEEKAQTETKKVKGFKK